METQRVYADFHIHSKYSRATSEKMDMADITSFARLKGLNLVGTGDFSHPLWINELNRSLEEVSASGLYKLRDNPQTEVYFMLTNEVCTISEFEGKTRKIHHVLFAPSLDTAEQVNDRLKAFGDLEVDGRPTLNMSPPELVEEVMAVSRENVVVPAHAWTPWFSLFGSVNGFDRVEDCYQDMTRHIFALETGLSSDPPMNWRLSALDRYALISNSDSHSPYPSRLGREANVFEVQELTYHQIVDAIRKKDGKRFKFTIETNPAYGKYHWTGHRSCNVSVSPTESRKLRGKCPVCGRPLTRGVEERVEDLADRPVGFEPEGAIDYRHLLPLHEVIGMVLGVENLYAPSIWRVFNSLASKFGNEYTVLLDAGREELVRVVDEELADAIVRVRKGEVTVIPGYDGVYGKLVISKEIREVHASKKEQHSRKQVGLEDFM